MSNDNEVELSDDDSESLNFIKDNIIYIHGEFDYSISTKIIPNLKNIIDNQKKLKDGKIVFDINSYGGYVTMLFELLSYIEYAKKEDVIVETRSNADAHSCGAMLLVSGTKGHRYASPFTEALVHHASSSMHHSTDIQLERGVDKAKRMNSMLKNLLKKYTQIPVKEIDEMLKDDGYYVHAEKLLEYKMVDEITFKI